jgi:hypothetical protein
MVYFAMIYDKKKFKKIFWHAKCIYKKATKKTTEAKMKVEKRISTEMVTLIVEINNITFKEIILLNRKDFDKEVKNAVMMLQLKIENYKKAQELNLIELLSN